MRRNIALVLAALTLTTALPMAGYAEEPRQRVLDGGHIDLFDVVYDSSRGGLTLEVGDGSGSYYPGTGFGDTQYWHPDTVTINVDTTFSEFVLPDDLPAGYEFLGSPGDTVYRLPQDFDLDLPWPGWASERLEASLPDGTVASSDTDAIEVVIEVDGPGDLFTWMTSFDGTGEPFDRFIDTADPAPDVITMPVGAHVHTTWGFTEIGDYLITATPSLRLGNGDVMEGDPVEYHILVGDRIVTHWLEYDSPDVSGPSEAAAGESVTLTLPDSDDLETFQWLFTPSGSLSFESSVVGGDSATYTFEATRSGNISAIGYDAMGRLSSYGNGALRVLYDYDDVPSDHVFTEAISWLAGAGITLGCNPPTNDRFCPDDPVTRGQMAAFIRRVAGEVLPEESTPTNFVDLAGSVFAEDITWLSATGVTRGCNPPDNDRFCPDGPVTRGQMAAFIVRAFGGFIYGEETVEFSDIDGSPFVADIEAIATAGITVGCNPPTNDRFCPDDPVTRGQMAAFIRRIFSWE